MHIHLLTCKELPDLSSDDQIWRDYLLSRNHKVTVGIWGEDFSYTRDTVVVIRSCWDYVDNRADFIIWLRSLKCKLYNTISTISQFSDKIYLSYCGLEGIDTVPTRYYGEIDPTWDKVVIKPKVSNAGRNVYIIDSNYLKTLPAWVQVSDDYLIQPFIEEIVNGEYSCVYIDSEYSHCVHKVPSEGEFRVQHFYGGQYSLVTEPDKELLEAASNCNRYLRSYDPLYARYDFIKHKEQWLLSEIEVVEPWLHFDLCPQAVVKITDALEKRYNARTFNRNDSCGEKFVCETTSR